MGLYMNSLVKKLLRCWEIRERYRLEFKKQIESYVPPSPQTRAVNIPSVMRLEEDCHNFLYEAKNFARDLLKVFNALYGTQFEEASEYYRGRKGGESVVAFARRTFGAEDARTEVVEAAAPPIEYFVALRNAVEHPSGYSGTLHIRNFRLDANGKLSEPAWWREEKGTKTPEASIRADFDGIIDDLLTVGEDILVYWAQVNLRMPQFMRIAFVPKENRDPSNPIKYIVTASDELVQKIAELQNQRGPT